MIAVAFILYIAVLVYDKTSLKRKMRQNTKELCKITLEEDSEVKEEVSEPVLIPIEEKKEEVVVNDSLVLEPISEPVSEVKIEEPIREEVVEPIIVKDEEVSDSDVGSTNEVVSDELQYTSIEPNQSEAQAELMKLTETLEKAEEEVKNIDLTAFEEEQEQNAIISLDELMSRGKAMYESGELEKLEDEGNEPISIQDLEERMKVANESSSVVSVTAEPVIAESSPITEQMVLNDFQTVSIEEEAPVKPEESTVYQEHKKFKSSPIISPVFGIEKMEATTASDIELENTANFEKLDEEIRKTNEFLMTLKELQKKLD